MQSQEEKPAKIAWQLRTVKPNNPKTGLGNEFEVAQGVEIQDSAQKSWEEKTNLVPLTPGKQNLIPSPISLSALFYHF